AHVHRLGEPAVHARPGKPARLTAKGHGNPPGHRRGRQDVPQVRGVRRRGHLKPVPAHRRPSTRTPSPPPLSPDVEGEGRNSAPLSPAASAGWLASPLSPAASAGWLAPPVSPAASASRIASPLSPAAGGVG